MPYDHDHTQRGFAVDLSEFLPFLEVSSGQRTFERDFARGEQLFRRGDAPQFMFYILSGEARLLRHSPAGMEVVFQRARRGFLAEASLDQPAYHCDGLAAEDSKVLAIHIGSFRAALSNENVRTLWLRHLSNELRRARAHSERLSLRAASDRIVHFIETEGSGGALALSQSKKSWAAELGLTHEALYRALALMQRQGTLSVLGPVLKLGKPASLTSGRTSASRRARPNS